MRRDLKKPKILVALVALLVLSVIVVRVVVVSLRVLQETTYEVIEFPSTIMSYTTLISLY
jgi:hypothetical protein